MYYDEKNIFLIKPLWLFILISSSILIISSCIKNHPHKTPPIAKNGKLDLTSWNLKKDGPVKLNGQWEFYWMRYLAAKDFKNAETPKRSGYIKTPGVWNGYRIGTKKITGIGFATYRLKIFFNKKKINKYDSNNSFAIKLPDISSAYNLFINGKKITSVGTIGNSAQTTIPKNYPHVVVFKQKNNKVEIIFQIANFHQKKGGLWHAIQFGTEEDIRNTRERSLTFELFIFGSLFIMGLYHLGLFILRKKDKSPLYLGIFCLLISLRILVTGEYYLTHLVPIESWELIRKLTALTFYTATVFFIMFIRSLFPEEFSKIIYKICASIGIIYSIIVIITPANVYTYTVTSFQIITILACIYSIFILIIASIRGRKGAIVFLGGFFVLFLSVLNDILYHNGIIITGDFVSIGLFVFIFSQAYLLSYRFSRAFKTVENLSNELKLKSNDLEEKNIKLIELDKLKDEFLANTSHELKTPLTGIIGIAESMLDGIAGELTKKATANLYTIIYSGRRLSNLVNDILDFSKLKNQELELQIKPVDVYAITDLVLLLSKALIGKKEIALHNQISPEVPFVEADEDRLQQILYNLIGNAIKFTELGSVNISTETVNDMLEISVTDTGVGIPENNLDRIFESFEQGDGSIARTFGGTGLGLAITKQLVELHNGEIRVKSHIGKGSKFTFSLPISKKRTSELTSDTTQSMHYSSNLGLKFNFHDEIFSDTIQAYQSTSESESDCGSFKILIVDDDPVNIQVLSNQLSLMNYSISTATNGMKVLDMIQSGENFDLILLDIMMPKLSGYEVCKEIRKVASANELPIIFITAKSLVSDLIIGFESGANDYIVKPFDKRELLTRVRTALRLKEAFNERQELIQMEKELSIAEMVQRSVLTSKEYYCKIEYLDIDVQYIPINKKVGGDYYNISILSDASTSIMIADATGHGIQAALSTMQIDILNKQSLVKHNPPLRLKYINELLINEIKSKNFFSAFMLEINKEKILYSSAGQSTQLLIKGKTKELKYLQTKGKLIGIKQNVTYKMEEETIESGDIIFLFTDGIFEEFNSQNEQFGEARFFKLVNKILTDFPDTYPMAEINTLIIKEVEAFIKDAEFNDDITLIGIRVL